MSSRAKRSISLMSTNEILYVPKCNFFIRLKKVAFLFLLLIAIQQTGSASPQNNDAGSGWIYTKHGPLTVGSGWNDTFYLEMVPQDQINLNPALVQNPGYNELFGL